MLRRVAHYFIKKYSVPPSEFSIFDEDWDNLIILDACRYDYFEMIYSAYGLPGRLEKRISPATETRGFLRRNFVEKRFDVVYITANPFVDLTIAGRVHRIISVWKTDWDSRFNTVHPESVFKWAVYASRKYKTKRLIIHFVQPHYPYIGFDFDDGSFKQLKESAETGKAAYVSCKTKPWVIAPAPIYFMADEKTQRQGYLHNLQLAVKYVEKLINILPGRTVVTADHGEAFGEKIHPLLPFKIYGHPDGVRHKVLVEVPWLVVEEEEKEYPEREEQVLTKMYYSCLLRDMRKESLKKLKNILRKK